MSGDTIVIVLAIAVLALGLFGSRLIGWWTSRQIEKEGLRDGDRD